MATNQQITTNTSTIANRPPSWFASFCRTAMQFLHINPDPGMNLQPYFVHYCSECGHWTAVSTFEYFTCCDKLMWSTHSYTTENVLLLIHCSTCRRHTVSQTPRMLPWTRCCNEDQISNLRFLHLRDMSIHNVQLISYNGDYEDIPPNLTKIGIYVN